jgi:hypothetical protein
MAKSGRLGGEVASCGEAEDADAVGGDAPFLCVGADGAEGALRVLEFDGVVIARAEAVLQHERGDASGVEEARDLAAFVIRGEVKVAAAGEDEDGGHSLGCVAGQVGGHLRDVRGVGALRAGCGSGPQAQGLAVLQWLLRESEWDGEGG